MSRKKVISLQVVKQKKIDEEMMSRLELSEHNDESVFELASVITRDMVELLEDFGYYAQDNDDSIKDIILIIEAIKGLIFRTQNETYSMHEITNTLIEVDEPGELLDNFMDNY